MSNSRRSFRDNASCRDGSDDGRSITTSRPNRLRDTRAFSGGWTRWVRQIDAELATEPDPPLLHTRYLEGSPLLRHIANSDRVGFVRQRRSESCTGLPPSYPFWWR